MLSKHIISKKKIRRFSLDEALTSYPTYLWFLSSGWIDILYIRECRDLTGQHRSDQFTYCRPATGLIKILIPGKHHVQSKTIV